MISPDDAMEQAHATARRYARMGMEAYEDYFDMSVAANPQAAATFLAGFMQAASIDFVGWAIQNQIEGLRGTIDSTADDFIDVAVSFRKED